MKSILDGQSVSIPCPRCGQKTAKTVAWLKDNDHFTCACGVRINLDSSEFRRELGIADQSISRFGKSIRRLGK